MIAAMIALLATAGVSGGAPSSALEPVFTATIVSTYPDGRVSKVWLDRDGSFNALGRDRDATGGRWWIKGDDICLRQVKPFPIPFAHYCTAMPHGDVAQGWAAKAVTGEPIRMKIVPGR